MAPKPVSILPLPRRQSFKARRARRLASPQPRTQIVFWDEIVAAVPNKGGLILKLIAHSA